MSKAIKVDDTLYNQLDRLKTGRQTFSDVINELLKARLTIFEALSALEGQLKFREWQQKRYNNTPH